MEPLILGLPKSRTPRKDLQTWTSGYRFIRASHKVLLISLAVTYRRMNLPPSAQQVTDPQRLTAHLYSTLRRLHSYLQYIRFVKYVKATENLAANYKKSTLPD
jgi:hypothetical protein